MTLEQKAAQLVVPGLNGVYTPTDSAAFEKLEHLAREGRVGGFHVFGGAEALPPLLLNPVVRQLRRPHDAGPTRWPSPCCSTACSSSRRCRCCSPPTSRAAPATSSRAPRGCRGRWRSAPPVTRRWPRRPGRLAAGEGRALGIHVDFYPVVDVNNNPRNPIINVRSFGEDPALVVATRRRLHEGDPGGRDALDRKALPRPRRHGDGHAPRPRGDRQAAGRARRGGAAAVQGRDRRRDRRRDVEPHPAARAGRDRGPAGDAEPPDPDRPAAAGARLRGARLHGFDVDARDQQALRAGGGGGARGRGRGRRGARPTGPGRGDSRDPRRGRRRAHPPGAAGALGRADPARQGAARARPRARRRRERGALEPGGPSARRSRRGDRRAGADPAQGRRRAGCPCAPRRPRACCSSR